MFRSFGLADFLTFGNLACGLAAIFGAMRAIVSQVSVDLVTAIAFLPAALVCDILDGPIARWRQTQSPRGRELDSLSDAISFGTAPAVITYAAGYTSGWDTLVLTFFLACGVARLARFNVTSDALSFGRDKVRYVEGVPIPTTVLFMVVFAFLAWRGKLNRWVELGTSYIAPWTLHPTVLIFGLLGILMVSSSIRVRKP